MTLDEEDLPCSEAGAAADEPMDGEQPLPPPVAAAEQPDQHDDSTDGGRLTGARLREKAGLQVYPGATLTVMQISYFFLSWKQRHGIKCNAVNELLRALADSLLPAGNLMVPSLHLLKAVTECVGLKQGHPCIVLLKLSVYMPAGI